MPDSPRWRVSGPTVVLWFVLHHKIKPRNSWGQFVPRSFRTRAHFCSVLLYIEKTLFTALTIWNMRGCAPGCIEHRSLLAMAQATRALHSVCQGWVVLLSAPTIVAIYRLFVCFFVISFIRHLLPPRVCRLLGFATPPLIPHWISTIFCHAELIYSNKISKCLVQPTTRVPKATSSSKQTTKGFPLNYHANNVPPTGSAQNLDYAFLLYVAFKNNHRQVVEGPMSVSHVPCALYMKQNRCRNKRAVDVREERSCAIGDERYWYVL